MRILYLSKGNIPSKYAHTFQIMKMAEALASHVKSLKVVTARGLFTEGSEKKIDLFDWYNVESTFRVVSIPVNLRLPALMRGGNNPRYEKLAALYARLTRPDLVYARSPAIAQHCVDMGLTTIVETHGDPKRRVEQVRKLTRHPKLLGLVTINDFLKNGYVAAGVSEEKIFVSSSAVDLKGFEGLPAKAVIRNNFGLPEDRPVAVYCGHFYEKKGVPCLVDAARSLPDVDFYLVGGWPDDIEQMQIRAGNSSNIHFTGFVSNHQVPRYLAAADVLVLPNSAKTEHAQDTSPLKLFEYMGAGRPIVATAIPALKDILMHRKNSYIVEPDSVESLAAGIRAVLDEPETASAMARQAWKDVQPFTWDKRAEKILTHYGLL